MAKIITSDNFEDCYNKLDKSIKIQIDKLLVKIINNPEIGKPMRFQRKETREVYAGSFRLSYSYEKQIDTIFILELYHKDNQ